MAPVASRFGEFLSPIPAKKRSKSDRLLQLRVLRFGLLEDGDVGISVLPQGEKIVISDEGPAAGSIGGDTLVCPRLQGVRAPQSEMCQRAGRTVPDDSAVLEYFLELTGGSASLARG